MNAAQLRSKTINLGAESPIQFELQDGTVLHCTGTLEIQNIAEDDNGTRTKAGPPRLVFVLVDPLQKPVPVEPKVAGKHTKGTGW